MNSRRDDSPLRRSLELLELDLLRTLRKKFESLPPERLRSPPYPSYREEMRKWIRRIEENRR